MNIDNKLISDLVANYNPDLEVGNITDLEGGSAQVYKVELTSTTIV